MTFYDSLFSSAVYFAILFISNFLLEQTIHKQLIKAYQIMLSSVRKPKSFYTRLPVVSSVSTSNMVSIVCNGKGLSTLHDHAGKNDLGKPLCKLATKYTQYEMNDKSIDTNFKFSNPLSTLRKLMKSITGLVEVHDFNKPQLL